MAYPHASLPVCVPILGPPPYIGFYHHVPITTEFEGVLYSGLPDAIKNFPRGSVWTSEGQKEFARLITLYREIGVPPGLEPVPASKNPVRGKVYKNTKSDVEVSSLEIADSQRKVKKKVEAWLESGSYNVNPSDGTDPDFYNNRWTKSQCVVRINFKNLNDLRLENINNDPK